MPNAVSKKFALAALAALVLSGLFLALVIGFEDDTKTPEKPGQANSLKEVISRADCQLYKLGEEDLLAYLQGQDKIDVGNPPVIGPFIETGPRTIPDQDYTTKDQPDPGKVFHYMVHGGLVFEIKDDASQELLDKVRSLYKRNSEKALLQYNQTNMPANWAVVALGASMTCQEVTSETSRALQMFGDYYQGS